MQDATHRNLIRRLWMHINLERRVQLFLLFWVMVLSAFVEIISIGAVLPFLGALTSPEQIFAHPIAAPFIQALSLTKPEQLLLPFTATFVIGALLSGVMRLLLIWAQTRIGHAIGADLSISIYRK